MKRCPECQFLYENEALQCDMDGTPLRYTVALPNLPGLTKSIWDKWTIGLLGAVILITVLVIMYRATPRAYTSTLPTQGQAADAMLPTDRNAQSAETATPPDSSVMQDVSGSEGQDPTSSSEDSDGTREPFESLSPTIASRSQRSKRPSPLADEKDSLPAQAIHFEPGSGLPASGKSSAAGQPTATETNAKEKSAVQTSPQITATSAASATVHPKPPSDYANKPATETQKKDSGFKSLLKKAGKVLKKPFGEN
jgi:hypothetical protein